MSAPIKFLSSLKLTVALLALGLMLIFVGTLAQVHEGLYNAQVRFFKSWFVIGVTAFNVKLPWLVLPGGYTLGLALLAINPSLVFRDMIISDNKWRVMVT